MKRFLPRFVLIISFISLGVFFYFRVFPATFLLQERHKSQAKTRATTLNLIKPSFEDFVAYRIAHGQAGISRSYLSYYEKLTEYMPQKSEAHAMLGFCYYHARRNEEAVVSFHRAIQLDPDYFWTLYNLGVIYFNQGQYQQAAGMFKRALSLKREVTLKAIFASKIYGEIILSAKNFDYTIEKNLQVGYQDAYRLLIFSEDQMKGTKHVPSLTERNQVPIQFF